MGKGELVEMSMEFAVRVVNEFGKPKSHFSIFDQALRAGTSIGANVHEASYGASKADFTNKLQIALKECYETEYWLELMRRTELVSEEVAKSMLSDCKKIRYKLSRSLNTAKGIEE